MTTKNSDSALRLQTAAIATIAAGFLLWSAVFIFRASIVAIDGKRYFTLFDDALVSLRYAWNFSHGLGLVWNPGERVEGFSNLLMTLLMVFPTSVFDKSGAVLAIQIVGVGFMLGIGYLNMRISDRIFRDHAEPTRFAARVLAFLGGLLYYPLSYWTLLGMETGLLALLLLLAVIGTLDYAEEPRPARLFIIAAALGLAFLARNDSLIFAVPLGAYVASQMMRPGADRRALFPLVAAVGIYALFIAAQFVFNHSYYGEWLPNTYVLKLTGMPLQRRLSNGILFIGPFLVEMAPVLGLAVLGIALQYRREILLFLALTAVAVLYEVRVGGDAWNYWRIMAPTVPLLLIAVIACATALSDRLGHAPRLRIAVLIALTLLGLLTANWRFLPQLSLQQPAYEVPEVQDHVDMAVAISQVTTDNASVGVFWAGAIPYYTGRFGVDFLGKSDAHIARLPAGPLGWPGHDKADLNYSIKLLVPTFVEGFIRRQQDLTAWATTRYVTVEYDGMRLSFLRDSPAVLWSKVTILNP